MPGELRVPLAIVLREMKTELARQVEEPTAVLLAAADRPKILPRPFIELGMNYGLFMRLAVRVNLQRLVPMWKVWHHRGLLLVSRTFAVPIDKK